MSRLSPLREVFLAHGRVDDCPIYDMHGHMGPTTGLHIHVPDTCAMIHGMDRAGVRRLVFSHHLALHSPDTGNAPSISAVRAFPERLRAYCAVNPNYPELLRREIDVFDSHRDVYVGFKFLSDYHRRKVTDNRYQPVLEKANRERLLVLFHTWGGSKYDGYEQICGVAERYPNAKMIIGHSLHGDWDLAIDVVRRFPNTHLELCAVMDERGVLERLVNKLGSERILFGTDFPWFSYHYYIGTLLGAGITDEDRRNIFYRNAQRLLGEKVEDES